MLWRLVLALIVTQVANCLVIETPCGSLKGAVSPTADDVYRFLGVPFAEAPVRFEKATQKMSWEGTRDATFYRDSCVQPNLQTGELSGSEDCLTLDVYSPVDLSNVNVSDPANQVAVMVWIYGGAFSIGSTNQYEGTKLARDGNVVVIAIQYRLGAFGWLYSYGTKPSNIGLWDQKLALEWVQQNVYAFGGDNSKVTIFGESAGAMSVSALVMSPLMNNSTFQRAIMQSGSVINGDPTQHVRGEAMKKLSSLCPSEDLDEKMACLQGVDAAVLLQETSALLFLPIQDHQFITSSPSNLLRNFAAQGIGSIRPNIGNMEQYDILSGFNGQEGYLILVPLANILGMDLDDGILGFKYTFMVSTQIASIARVMVGPIEELTAYLKANYDESLAEHPSNADNNMNNLLTMLGDFVMAIPTISTARIHTKAILDGKTERKHYMYLFDHIPSYGSFLVGGPEWLQTSASHGDDIAFILDLNNSTDNKTPDENVLSKTMRDYWTNFAKTGNPNSGNNVEWKEYTEETANFIRLALNNVSSEVNPRGDKPQVWDCVYRVAYNNNPGVCNLKSEAAASADSKIQPKVAVSGDGITFKHAFLRRPHDINERVLVSSGNRYKATTLLATSALLVLSLLL